MNDHDQEEAHKDLLWRVELSVRYHDRRQGFFQRCYTLVRVVGMLAGSTTVLAFGDIVGKDWPDWLKALPMVGVTVLFAIDAIVSFASRAWVHGDLKRRFIWLERECRTADADRADETNRLMAEVLRIEADEPPTLHVLNAMCHNEMLRAWGLDAKPRPIKWRQRLAAHFFDWGDHSIP